MFGTTISIVIPVYNAAKFLHRCLNSVLSQDYKNIEIICVNDGSTDNSLQILEEFSDKDKRIKVISQPNAGAAAARNRGIKEAKGEYISFVDADDYLSQGLYSHFIKVLKSGNIDIFMFNGIVGEGGKFFTERNFYYPINEDMFIDYKAFYGIFYGNSGVCNKIFKRKFLQDNKLKFLEGNSYEDIDFWFRSLILAQKVKVSFECWYNYCFDNENSVTRTFGKNAFSLFDTFNSMMLAAKKVGLMGFFNDALLQFQYEKSTEVLSLMKDEYKERMYGKVKEFLQRRVREMKSNSYTRLMNYGICHNILLNNFADFKNTTLLFRGDFNYWHKEVKNPRFSIVVPVYNVELYLDTCLKSLINQTFRKFEIICVNDGSTDKSLQILEHHAQKDKRIRIINQENKGLGAARNEGVKYAKGDYLLFVDSDDWMRTDALEILDYQLKQKSPDVCLFGFSNFEDTHKFNIPVGFLQNLEQGGNKTKFDYMFANVMACGKVYKREFWQKNQITFAEGVFFEDNVTNMMVFTYANDCEVCWHDFYYYRLRGNSITKVTFSDKKTDDLFSAFEKSLEFLKKQSFFDLIKERFAEFCRNSLRSYESKIEKDKLNLYMQRYERLLAKIW